MTDLTTQPPNPLIERARRGERAAMEALLASVAPSIHRFSLRMCKGAGDADDVLQDTLVSVAMNLRGFEGRASLTSWVFSLARSACARRRRGLKNRTMESDDGAPELVDSAPTPEAVTADRELSTALLFALDALPEDYREIITLRDIEGLSALDVAASLDITVDAVKSRLHRARESLRNSLRPMLEPHAPTAPGGCPDVVALWSRKLEGDLSHTDCAAMEKHIARCAVCAGACDALRQALLACRRTASETVPPEVQSRVKSALSVWINSRK